MSNSVTPHRRQPTRLPRPRDSPGKNTGVGCHFLLQCMKAKSESEVTQLCLTPRDPMDRSPPGSPIHGIFQARVLEWGAIAFSNCLDVQKPRLYIVPMNVSMMTDSHTSDTSIRVYLRGLESPPHWLCNPLASILRCSQFGGFNLVEYL